MEILNIWNLELRVLLFLFLLSRSVIGTGKVMRLTMCINSRLTIASGSDLTIDIFNWEEAI